MEENKFTTFIDIEKMEENGYICDEKALIHQKQLHEVCKIIQDRMKYKCYDPEENLQSVNNVGIIHFNLA